MASKVKRICVAKGGSGKEDAFAVVAGEGTERAEFAESLTLGGSEYGSGFKGVNVGVYGGDCPVGKQATEIWGGVELVEEARVRGVDTAGEGSTEGW
jgi:hypothetical protein